MLLDTTQIKHTNSYYVGVFKKINKIIHVNANVILMHIYIVLIQAMFEIIMGVINFALCGVNVARHAKAFKIHQYCNKNAFYIIARSVKYVQCIDSIPHY